MRLFSRLLIIAAMFPFLAAGFFCGFAFELMRIGKAGGEDTCGRFGQRLKDDLKDEHKR